MVASFLNGSELIPGYVTVDRIGAGGYGEVWKVRAPGGLDKAIKVIYGYVNEERAARELRALNRIKEIRHPFLLSLERIEVVANQLLVVTELADRSLMELFQECRANGLEGVPRQDLIGYLEDAAAALDYMLEKKGLQHLDIKPENLLLVGDRVKVADFGLVKELADQGQTLLGGLTPVYAAPEVFAGCASRQSDQYSLAIVYQQMLTGVLPFPGHTQQQLAAQHRQASPRLAPLSDSDRPVVARALSKEPAQRFSSCRAFVDALSHGVRAATVFTRAAEPPAGDQELDCDPSHSRETTSGRNTGTTVAGGTKHRPTGELAEPLRTEALQCDLDLPPVERPSRPQVVAAAAPIQVTGDVRDLKPLDADDCPRELRPSLVIGIGGTGSRVLQALKARLDARSGLAHGDAIGLLLLDIDREAIKNALEGSRGARLQPDEAFLLSLHRPQEYQTRSADLLQWISRRWLYNIPRTLTTQGFRPLGRLAWVDHAAKVSAALRERITRLITDESIQALETAGGLPCRNRFPRVILVGSTSGGTAGGMLLDVIQAVRHCLAAMNLPDDGLRAMLIHSTNRHPRESVLAAANTYAFLSELQHYCLSPHAAPADPKHTGTRTGGAWSAPPVTYFVNLGERLSEDAYDERIAAVADYLYCDTATCAGAALDQCRSLAAPAAGRDLHLRSFGLATLEAGDRELPARWTDLLCRQIVHNWLKTETPGPDQHSDCSPRADQGPQTHSVTSGQQSVGSDRHAGVPPLTAQLEELLEHEFGDWRHSRFVGDLRQFLLDALPSDGPVPSHESQAVLPGLAPSVANVARQLCGLVASLRAPAGAGAAAPGEDAAAAAAVAARSPAATSRRRQNLDQAMRESIPDLAEDVAARLLPQYLRGALPVRGSAAASEESVRRSLADFLRTAVNSAILTAVSQLDAGQTIDDGMLRSTPQQWLECLDAGAVGLPGCGFARRWFIVDRPDSPSRDALLAVPQATLLPAAVETALVWQEAEQISLAQLAHVLAEGRPEIVEAAMRLHTRRDISWTYPPAIRLVHD